MTVAYRSPGKSSGSVLGNWHGTGGSVLGGLL